MAAEQFDFGEFLALLEAKRAALDTLIASYKAALSVGALGQIGEGGIVVGGSADVQFSRGGPIDLPQGALLGKSLPAAIHLMMSAARRKLTIKEIVVGLKDGGVESTSRNFDNTVNTALHRLKRAGTVLKFNDGWALSEFYPENLRRNIAAQTDQKAAAKKPAAAKRKRTAKKQARVLALPVGEVSKEAVG